MVKVKLILLKPHRGIYTHLIEIDDQAVAICHSECGLTKESDDEIKTERASELVEGVHKVSIEANIDEVVESCNRKGCYNLIDGLTFEGIGITINPGVQTTTLNIVESYQDWKVIENTHCDTCTILEAEEQDDMKTKIEQLEKQVADLSKPKCTTCGKNKKI